VSTEIESISILLSAENLCVSRVGSPWCCARASISQGENRVVSRNSLARRSNISKIVRSWISW